MSKPLKSRPRSAETDEPGSREAILAAALTSFARDGYHGASMPKIARMAQVAPPLIHYYFGSKDNLWRETVKRSLGELRHEIASVTGATRALAPLDRLRALLQAVTRFAAYWPDHFAMLVAEMRSDSDRHVWIRENYSRVIYTEILSLLRAARDDRSLADVPLDRVAYMLVGGILLYFTAPAEILDSKDLDHASSEFADLMFRMFLRGLGNI